MRENYVIVQNGLSKIILYTKEQPIIDSTISFDGSPQLLTESYGFYRFSWKNYCAKNGIYYSISPEHIKLIKDSSSMRGWLQSQIESIQDPQRKELCKEVLLSIQSDESVFSSFLQNSGLSMVGVLVLLRPMFARLFRERTRKKVEIGVLIGFSLFYHFPLLLGQRCIREICQKLFSNKQESLGISTMLVLFLYPGAIVSPGFWIPFIIRYTRLFFIQEPKMARTFFLCIYQSLTFFSTNLLQMYLFPYLLPLFGIMWILTILVIWLPFPFLTQIIQFIDMCLKGFDFFQWKGSILGFGLIFFLPLCMSFRKSKKPIQNCLICLSLFLSLGLFHPFAEVTFINVGQGDSILIRAPLNQGNILVDTGKPSQYAAVQSILDAKGITTLQGLIITHSDSDHSGNRDAILEDYKPTIVRTTHVFQTEISPFVFYDLNQLKNSDENESSIADVFTLNGLTYMLMGDCDSISEELMAETYGNLQVDVLKLAHHGSKTGNSQRFLETIQPRLSIVSAGAYSIYHHPSPEVVERLEENHIPTLSTRIEGDITIVALPGLNLLLTSNGKIGIIKPDDYNPNR